jgi:hypothetical protein
MVETNQRKTLIEPESNLRPLADAIFSNAYIDLLKSGHGFFKFDLPWTNAPASVELEVDSHVFRLQFNDGRLVQGTPWDLLERQILPGNLPSFVAHNAIRAVWEKMLESFASAVARGRHRLFARLGDVNAAFEPIPKDHWRHYRVTSWLTGEAIAPDGRKAWSMHVLSEQISRSPAGRKPVYDQDQVNGEVRRLYRELGPYGPNEERGWQTRADLEGRVAQFLLATMGQIPSKSTLQELVKKAEQAVKAD